MTDIFAEALEDLKTALTNGDAVDQALREIAEEHGLKVDALRRRAERAYGDLATYGSKAAAVNSALDEAAKRQKFMERVKDVHKRAYARTGDLTPEEWEIFWNY